MRAFSPGDAELMQVLHAFGLPDRIQGKSTLLQYDYQQENPDSRELRLIVKVNCGPGRVFVVKFIWEADKPRALMERQAAFSEFLRAGGIPAARRHRAGAVFCPEMVFQGWQAVVSAEDFEPGELTVMDAPMAGRIGALLGRMHALSVDAGYRLSGPTLFDVQGRNDIALLDAFLALRPQVLEALLPLYEEVEWGCRNRLAAVGEALKGISPFAVQGDISINNLFVNDKGLGVFDFNNAGDVHLVSDLVLEGLLLCRQMDYDRPWTPEYGEAMFCEYLKGYRSQRRLNPAEERALPHIHALGTCLYMMQVRWDEGSLYQLLPQGKKAQAEALLDTMKQQIGADFTC